MENSKEKYYLTEKERDSFFEAGYIFIDEIKYDNETVFMDKETIELMDKMEKIHKKIADYNGKKKLGKYIQLIEVLSEEEIKLMFQAQQNPARVFIFKELKCQQEK